MLLKARHALTEKQREQMATIKKVRGTGLSNNENVEVEGEPAEMNLETHM